MGHNRAGDARKKRLKRRKKEEQRLDRWARKVLDEFGVQRKSVWIFIGQCPTGPQLLYSPTEPSERMKVEVHLPSEMDFRSACDWIGDNEKEVDSLVKQGLLKLARKFQESH